MNEENQSPETETQSPETALMQHLMADEQETDIETEQPEEEESEESETEAADQQEGETEEDQSDDEDPEIELVHNGKPITKKLSDIKNLAQMGFDYSTKMQRLNADKESVSSDRQAVESTKRQLVESQQRYIESIELVERLYQDGGVSDDHLNKLLEEGDNDQYLKLKAQKEKNLSALNTLKAEKETARKQQEQATTAYIIEEQKKGQEVLKEKMPHLLEQKGSQDLYTYLNSSYGYSTDQLRTVTDPHLFIMAEKARLYDTMQAKVKEKVPPKLSKAVKSKSSPVKADAKQGSFKQSLQSLQKSGGKDLNALVETMRHFV
jgi:hypothetical protein